MKNMYNMSITKICKICRICQIICRICKICAPISLYEPPPFPYEPPPFRMQNMVKYDKKYAEYEHPPKKYAKKSKNSKISKICHLKPGLVSFHGSGLRIVFSVIYTQNM